MRDADVIVVGAGFGGLGCALGLAERGLRVLLVETLAYPGGCASTFSRGGHRFEAGATLSSGLGPGQLFRTWIDRLGLDVKARPLQPAVELRAPGLQLTVPADRAAFVEDMAARAGPHGKAVRRFFAEQARVAATLWQVLDDPSLLPPLSLGALARHAARVPRYGPLLSWVGKPLASVLRSFGADADPTLRLYLDALCQITVQCPAAEAEAPFALAVMDYWFRGAAHVEGGIGRLAEALVVGIERAGGKVELANRAKEVRREAGGDWVVETRRGPRRAGAVVLNLTPHAVRRVVRPDELSKSAGDRLAAMTREVEDGWGAAMLYLVARAPAGVSPDAFHLQLVSDPGAPLMSGNHVFFSASAAGEIDRAPAGHRTITCSTHVPMALYRARDEAGRAELVQWIQDGMRRTIARHAPDWWEGVVRQLPASPRTFARFTGRDLGYVGGVPRRSGWANYRGLRPTPLVPGLWLAGDSVFPGQSTLATATGGVRVAEAIARAM